MIDENEAKLDLEKRDIEKIKHQVQNDKNVTRLELDHNENLIADENVDEKKYPPNQRTEPFCLSNTPSISTCKYTANTHWHQAPSSTTQPQPTV